MTTVTAGNTDVFTFVTNDSLLITLDPSEVASINVRSASGKTKFQADIRKTSVIGPFAVGDVLHITAERGDIDYAVVSQELFGDGAYITQEQKSVPGVSVTGVLAAGSDGQIYLPDGTVSAAGVGSTTFAGLTDKATADLPSINTPLATALGTKALASDLTTLAGTVSTNTTNITNLGNDLSALTTQEANDVADLQSQIDGISVTALGSITGLTDGGVVDNWSILQGAVGPAELAGSFIAADGVESSVPQSGVYRVSKQIDVDPQLSMYWNARGGVTIVPDARIPGIVPGTPGTGTRTGGGAPGSVFRFVRRAPGFNKQAYEPLMGGFNIDATGLKNSASFTSAGTTSITSSAHGLQVGDVIFFDNAQDGTSLPTGIVNGNNLDISKSYQILSVTTNTFTVGAWVSGTTYGSAVTVGSGKGVWSTNCSGIRIPNCQTGSNANDPDQAFDNRKNYTAGTYHDMDIIGMSGYGILSEAGCGRLHLHSTRTVSNRMDGIHIGSNDTVFSGHWASGSNGGFSVFKGSGTGLYATTGNIWGSPAYRSLTCGALKLADTAYFALVANEFNDWLRADGDANFNAAGSISANMMHPHAENYSADGIGIDVQNSGDMRLQANVGIAGYQGLVLGLNAWTRTETVTFDTPYNFGGQQTMVSGKSQYGTAPQYLSWFGTFNSNKAMVEVFDGVCTAPNAKPWTGPIGSVTFTSGVADITWTAHPLIVGDRVMFHGASIPSGFTADSVAYYVISTTTNTFQVAATYGATTGISAGANGSGTCCGLSTAPYYITGSAQPAGVYVDSYRGVVKLWSVNGAAPKFMIGTSFKSQSWEGNPNYYCEIGSTDFSGGLPLRNVLYGQWEHDKAFGWTDNAFNAKQITTSGHTISASTAVQFYTTSGGTTIANATITLPTDLTQTRTLEIIFSSGGCTALTWTVSGAGSINTNTLPLPSIWSGAMHVRMVFRRDTNSWFVESVQGAASPYISLGTSGSLSADLTKGSNFLVGPLTGNCTIANPSGGQDGAEYTYLVKEDATGGRTVSLGGKFRKASGDGTFTTTASAVNLMKVKYCAADDKYDVIVFKAGLT